MKVKELKDYLAKYPDDEEIRVLGVETKKRMIWPSGETALIGITDAELPVLGVELYECMPMDPELVKVMEEDEENASDQKRDS